MSTGHEAGGGSGASAGAVRLDAAEVDPDAASSAALPGHSAAARTTPEEAAAPAAPGTGNPSQEPAVGPPAQDASSAKGPR